MMSFGWRPNQSCYENAAQVQQKASCPSAAWWYVLMGLAVVGGIAGRKK